MNRDDYRPIVPTAAAADAPPGTGGPQAGPVPGPAPDPLVAALRRSARFLREGWAFTTRLAEPMPRAYFAGWSL